MSHMLLQTGLPKFNDHSRQGRRGESPKRSIHLALRRGGWHPRIVARPDRQAALQCVRTWMGELMIRVLAALHVLGGASKTGRTHRSCCSSPSFDNPESASTSPLGALVMAW